MWIPRPRFCFALTPSHSLYQACGILGATVMPHALYLGSGIVQPRLREYDVKKGNVAAAAAGPDAESMSKYRPTLAAIKSCMTMSIVELTLALFTFALFVNSAILIVSGASLYGVDGATEADLFGIHDLLSSTLSPAAGTIFALALLLSGVSAGIVCTIAGQMVSEGQLRWSVRPWVRRLLTRSISITPSIIVAGALGKAGLSAALTGSQVALSVILPFVSAPLIYFTCRGKIMTVNDGMDGVVMKNSWWIAGWGVALWLLIAVMNVGESCSFAWFRVSVAWSSPADSAPACSSDRPRRHGPGLAARRDLPWSDARSTLVRGTSGRRAGTPRSPLFCVDRGLRGSSHAGASVARA